MQKTIREMVSDSTLQLIFRKLPLVMLVSKKNIHKHLKSLLKYSSLFQIHICMRMDFLGIFQPRHTYLNIGVDRRIQLASTKPDIKKIYKNETMSLFSSLNFIMKNINCL